jgi:hypothetical protein
MDAQPRNNIIYSGTLPGPVGNIATVIHSVPIDQQKQQFLDFYTFLSDDTSVLLQLNADKAYRVCLVGLPASSKVRIVHCMGLGSSAIGMTSPVDNNLLLLTGDGGIDIGTPIPLMLDTTVRSKQETFSMTEAQFFTQLESQGANYTWPLRRRSEAANSNTTTTIMQVAPIPAFLVMDGFTQDLDAADVYERILSLDDHEGEAFTHTKNFLLACLTSHNQGDNSPSIPQDILLTPPPAAARQWAISTFRRTFPTLQTPVDAPPGGGQNNANMDIAALLAQLLPQALGNNRQAIQEEKKDDDNAPHLMGMSKREMESTLQMCGLNATANPTLLPEWFQQCAEKGMTESYKLVIIRGQIMSNFKFEDAEVPLTTALLKVAAKRNWTGKEANINRPSLTNATEGLSLFLLLDLNEDEVAALNDDEAAVDLASVVRPDDIKALKQKFIAKVPTDQEKFMLLLERYANLLFALFTDECPFYKCVLRVIRSLKEYSRNARARLSLTTKASILWVIHKQSRRFAIGEVTVLEEFSHMHSQLQAKVSAYSHAETPKELIDNSKTEKPEKRKLEDKVPQPPPGDNKRAKPRVPPSGGNNSNRWHQRLREVLGTPLRTAGYPTFLAVMKYCNANPEEVYSRWSNKCAPNAFFGRCTLGMACRKDHSFPSETEVDKIIEITKKLQENPSGIKQG